MTKRADFGVFILRGQPITLAHMYIIEHGLAMCDRLIIVLGSSFSAPRWDFVPFREFIREDMIRSNLTLEQRKRVIFLHVKDYGNMTLWADKLSGKVIDAIGDSDATVALIGHAKDKPTGYYLQQFPDWGSINLPNYGNNLSATPIRDRYIRDESNYEFEQYARPFLPEGTLAVLSDFRRTNEFASLLNEKTFMVNYLKDYYDADEVALAKKENRKPRCSPYPPIFYCADPVVIQGNKVLLVTRGQYPGKGLLAHAGGHCAGDPAPEAAIRELYEETEIALPEAVVRGSIIGEKRYDDVNRSTRRQTISVAQFIHLTPQFRDGKVTPPPKVKGSDDAEKADWYTISELKREDMFEDAWLMLNDAMALIRK